MHEFYCRERGLRVREARKKGRNWAWMCTVSVKPWPDP